MKEYRIVLDFDINNCNDCPFKHERILHEGLDTRNVLSGTVSITRRETYCPLLKEIIEQPYTVNGYTTKCPLTKYTVDK